MITHPYHIPVYWTERKEEPEEEEKDKTKTRNRCLSDKSNRDEFLSLHQFR